MFENMNPLDRSTAWLEIFLLMLGAFLIGYLFARAYYKKKIKKALEEVKPAETKTYKVMDLDTDIPSGIKAVKTRERKGELASNTELKPTLNFESIGVSSEKDKDDLKQINGIGPFIEKKLNSIGIYTFEQISRFSKKDIEDVTNLIQFFPGRIERDDWVGQANGLI